MSLQKGMNIFILLISLFIATCNGDCPATAPAVGPCIFPVDPACTASGGTCDLVDGCCIPLVMTSDAPTIAPPFPDCMDVTSECSVNAYLCSNTLYQDLMKQKCPRTCGLCNNGVGPCIDNSCPSGLTCNSGFCINCKDVATNCNTNVPLCTNTLYKDLMKQKCKKTCGYC